METTHDYGQLIVKYSKTHVDVFRIRLYEGHAYNWCDTLIVNGNLRYATDQTAGLGVFDTCTPLSKLYEVWLNGVCIYKRPWWRIYD